MDILALDAFNTGDKTYIQFENESDARSGFDALQTVLKAKSLGNPSMYEEPVVLEGTDDEIAAAMSHLSRVDSEESVKYIRTL